MKLLKRPFLLLLLFRFRKVGEAPWQRLRGLDLINWQLTAWGLHPRNLPRAVEENSGL